MRAPLLFEIQSQVFFSYRYLKGAPEEDLSEFLQLVSCYYNYTELIMCHRHHYGNLCLR